MPASTKIDRVAGRLPRLISIEQETASGRDAISGALYAAGLSRSPELESYNSRPAGFCCVKSDATIGNGGEIVYSKLTLHDEETAAKLDLAVETLAYLKDTGRMHLSLKAGVHVHIGADRPVMLTPRNAASLYHLFCHLEDPLYRIAAAGWSRHRMDGSNSYAAVLRKGATTTARAMNYMNSTRYQGLNLTPYLAARSDCRCGAQTYGADDECTCTLNQCTVEFRLFNTTNNPLKLRAYAALALALVETARHKTFTPERFPPNAYDPGTRVTNNTHRLADWMLDGGLMLGESEKEAVHYCLDRIPGGNMTDEYPEGTDETTDDDDYEDDPDPDDDDYSPVMVDDDPRRCNCGQCQDRRRRRRLAFAGDEG